MIENCFRCRQRLGSRTDISVLYDTDYYQQDDAQQMWRSKIYREMNVVLSLVLFYCLRDLLPFNLSGVEFCLAKLKVFCSSKSGR